MLYRVLRRAYYIAESLRCTIGSLIYYFKLNLNLRNSLIIKKRFFLEYDLQNTSERINLPKIRDKSFVDALSSVSRSGKNYWTFSVEWPEPPIINILRADAKSVIESLVDFDIPENPWWIRRIGKNGRMRVGQRILSQSTAWTCAAESFIIFRKNCDPSESILRSDFSQGVRFIIWEELKKKGKIYSPSWNDYAIELPNPEEATTEFDKALIDVENQRGTTVDFPVDVVITWVDGSDHVWENKKNEAFSVAFNRDLVDGSNEGVRFESFDELKYCLRSIEQFAPWVRKIFIVTDKQTPKWLATSERLQVIDHTEIWSDCNELPVFNSHAIEANIHRIEGLSENYLYMNDDFLISRPISPDVFFHANGISKVFYSRALIGVGDVESTDNVSTVAAKNAQHILREDGFRVLNRKFYHAPYALRKSVITEIANRYSSVISATSGSKFRSKNDVALSGSFYFHYALAKGYAVESSIKYLYLDPINITSTARLRAAFCDGNFDCLVINDGSQIVDEAVRTVRMKKIISELEIIFQNPSSFEL